MTKKQNASGTQDVDDDDLNQRLSSIAESVRRLSDVRTEMPASRKFSENAGSAAGENRATAREAMPASFLGSEASESGQTQAVSGRMNSRSVANPVSEAGGKTASDTKNSLQSKTLPAPLPVKRTEAWPAWSPQAPLARSDRPAYDSAPALTLPGRRRPPPRPPWRTFFLFVLIPTAAAAIYFWFFASDQYVAEFRFAVTETTPATLSTMPAPMSSTSSTSSPTSLSAGISSLMGGGAISNGSSQNFLVVDYILSRQMIEDLQKRINLKSLYSKAGADWWARFGSNTSMEKFSDYWNSMVTANYDMITGLATAQVRAFSADDAKLIADNMVALSEDLVNRIAMRAKLDAVKFAENEVTRTDQRLLEIRSELTKYRQNEGVIDPNSSVVSSNTDVAKTLRANLAQMQASMNSMLNQKLDPSAPAVMVLASQIKATKQELSRVEREVSQKRDGQSILTDVVAKYEQLNLKWQYAQNMSLSAMQNLDQARSNAAAQTLYLTPYVRPTRPESASFPRRFQSALIVFLIAFGIWLSGLLIYRAMNERLA